MRLCRGWLTSPWLHWGLVYSIPMFFYLVNKLIALPVLLDMYTPESQQSLASTKSLGILFGTLEDFAVTTLLVVLLLLLELTVGWIATRALCVGNKRTLKVVTILARITHVLVVFGLVALVLAPAAADMVLIRTRGIRFTIDFDSQSTSDAQKTKKDTEPHEATTATEMIVETTLVALTFTILYVTFINLSSTWTRPSRPLDPLRVTFNTPVLATSGFAPVSSTASLVPVHRIPIESHAATEQSMRDSNDDLGLSLSRMTRDQSIIWLHTTGSHAAEPITKPRRFKLRSVVIPPPVRVVVLVVMGAVMYFGLVHIIYCTSQTAAVAVAGIGVKQEELCYFIGFLKKYGLYLDSCDLLIIGYGRYIIGKNAIVRTKVRTATHRNRC